MNDRLGTAGPVTRRRFAWRPLLWPLLRLMLRPSLLLPLLMIGPGAAAAALAAVPLLELQQAEFSGDDGATWSRVALPDTWAERGVDVGSAGRYRIAFELPAQPDEPVALLLTRLSTHHRVH